MTRRPSLPTPSGDTTATASAALSANVAAELARQAAQPLKPGLYLVATPIGNLADITLRALSVLSRADIVACEDTRHSRILLEHYGISAKTRPYHDHNGAEMRPELLAALGDGRRVALVSDAGTPLVSDPGHKLVRAVIEAGHHVECLPGPSAVLTALTASGLPSETFVFAGFLPPKSAARRTRAEALASITATLVFFEAPSRIAASLSDLAAVLGDRPAAVARELTKRYETFARGPLATLAVTLAATEPRGEYVIVVGPPETAAIASDETITNALTAALETESLRDATRLVADRFAVPKSRVYDLALALRPRD